MIHIRPSSTPLLADCLGAEMAGRCVDARAGRLHMVVRYAGGPPGVWMTEDAGEAADFVIDALLGRDPGLDLQSDTLETMTDAPTLLVCCREEMISAVARGLKRWMRR
jgi:hypothetical protein